MKEKLKFKKITQNIDYISKKVDTIMNSRLIISIFMIVDGVCLIIDPINKMEFTAQFVAFCALWASFATLATNFKPEKRNLKSIIIATIIIIICIYLMIFPHILAINLRMLLAIFIIFNGLINIFNIIKLDKISSYILDTENDIKRKFEKNETHIFFNKDVIIEQTEKISNPFNNFIKKVNEKSILYFILNNISVILGIILFTTDKITFIVCGLILIYTGAFDLLMFIKSVKLSKRLK